MIRAISYSEGQTLLSCQAKHDFRYGDRLAGTSLKQKAVPPLLRDGKAWGRAMAAYHSAPENRLEAGSVALSEALEEDAAEQREQGLYDPDTHREVQMMLRELLEHYDAELVDPFNLQNPELTFLVPLPSRTGKQDSNRYRLEVHFDGTESDSADRDWLIEFKLRTRLTPLDFIAGSRQIRYYAWAYRKETGRDVAGVIVNERLKAVPKPARTVRNNSAASHAKDQLTTVADYIATCERFGEEPKPEVVEALGARRWQQTERVFLTNEEIDEAGTELVSLGQQVQALDSHTIYPVRNKTQANCNACAYKDICNNPHDSDLVDALFDRRPPKRDREEITV